jgi:hypothetical protein
MDDHTCEVCNLTFDSDKELQEHRSVEHGEDDQVSPRLNADDKTRAA